MNPTTPQAIVDAIAAAVDGARAGHEITGVGIGAAGYVDRQRSTVYFAPNIDWRQEPLKDEVESRVGLPVVVENDANAAAWGEYRFGGGKGHRNVICITLGTGLGGGIIIGDKLRRGHFGVAAGNLDLTSFEATSKKPSVNAGLAFGPAGIIAKYFG